MEDRTYRLRDTDITCKTSDLCFCLMEYGCQYIDSIDEFALAKKSAKEIANIINEIGEKGNLSFGLYPFRLFDQRNKDYISSMDQRLLFPLLLQQGCLYLNRNWFYKKRRTELLLPYFSYIFSMPLDLSALLSYFKNNQVIEDNGEVKPLAILYQKQNLRRPY